MENRTSYKIPQKYQHMVQLVMRDQDGVWIYLNDGYESNSTGSEVIHEDTFRECMAQLRNAYFVG